MCASLYHCQRWIDPCLVSVPCTTASFPFSFPLQSIKTGVVRYVRVRDASTCRQQQDGDRHIHWPHHMHRSPLAYAGAPCPFCPCPFCPCPWLVFLAHLHLPPPAHMWCNAASSYGVQRSRLIWGATQLAGGRVQLVHNTTQRRRPRFMKGAREGGPLECPNACWGYVLGVRTSPAGGASNTATS